MTFLFMLSCILVTNKFCSMYSYWVYGISTSFIPYIFIAVLLLPELPLLSITVQVCTPASRDLSMPSDIVDEVELEAKQELQVDDHL